MKKVIIFSLFWLSVIFNLFISIFTLINLIFLNQSEMNWGHEAGGFIYKNRLNFSLFWGIWVVILLFPTLYALYKKYKKYSRLLIFTLVPTILFFIYLIIFRISINNI